MRIFVIVSVVLALGVVDGGTGAVQVVPTCVQDFPTAALPDPHASVVMCGLDNPRGLAFDHDALYVAEAGRGGLGAGTGDCFIGQAGGMRCYAPNGAISRLSDGVQERIVTGLPSHANLQGRNAIGPHDVAFAGGMFVAIGLQQPPSFREQFPFLADFARVAEILPDGQWQSVADLGAYETEHDPDQLYYNPAKLDTNPFGLLALPGHDLLVVDAGANAVVRLEAGGAASTHAVLAPHPADSQDDSVPTAVERGPDGAYYIGELTGFPVVPGAASVYRLPHGAEAPELCLTGFTLVIDIAFDHRGRLYVLEHGGQLLRVTPRRPAAADRGGQPVLCAQYAGGEREVLVTGLTSPTSVVVGRDGAVFVSNRGIFPATGQVIRFSAD